MSTFETQRADAIRFQRFLWHRQHPSDCRAVVGLLTRAGVKPDGEKYPGDYFYGLGLGSQMASLKYNFFDALLKGRVYHFPTSHYVNPIRCPSQSFDCYFEPPSNCTVVVTAGPSGSASAERRVHRRVDTAPLLWCFQLPRRRLSRLAGLHAVHPEAWYQAQAASFLFRPNAEMRAFRTELMPRFAFDANHTRAAAIGATGGGLHNDSCVAMHIRRTDKFKGRRREDLRSAVGFAGFSRAFKSWAFWVATRPASQSRVLLGSEDPLTFRAMPPLLAPTVAYWIPGSYFVMASFKVCALAIGSHAF